jgi:hypothetical protein
MLAGIFIGMLIGAVVGGFMAAINGGEIGKGVLYGAVAGAIIGGISSWLGGALSSTASAPQSAWAGSAGEAAATGQVVGGAHPIASSAAASSGASQTTSKFGWQSFAESQGGGMMGEAAIMMGGSALANYAQGNAMAEAQEKASKEAAEQARLNREHEEKLLARKLAVEGDDSALMAKLAEERRQFDLDHGLMVRKYEEDRQERLDSFKRSSGALEQAVAARKHSMRPDSPSILQQLEDERSTHPTGMPQMDEEGNVAYG